MRNILKQTSWFFFAQSLTRVIGFFYTIFLARTLGVSNFGLFSVALAYYAIISTIADFGFNRFLIREIAKDKARIGELLWNIAILRLTLTSVLFGGFAIFLYILDQDKMRVSLILLAVFAILPQAIALTFDSIFVALRKLQFSAFALFISGLVTALAGLILISKGFGSIGAVIALVFGQLIYAIVSIILLYTNFGLHLSNIKYSIIKRTIIGSLPYGLVGVLGLLYFKIDTIMLSYFRGSFETGIYSAAYKFLEAAVLVPASLSLAIFPVMVKLHDTDLKKLKRLYYKTISITAVLGVIVGLVYLFILPNFLPVLLPNYLSSIKVIKILALCIPFMFIHVSASQVLLSSDKNLKSLIFITFLLLAFNVFSNFIFIPQFGYIGAAWVTVASDIFASIVLLIFLQRFFSKK